LGGFGADMSEQTKQRRKMTEAVDNSRDIKIQAVEAFLSGLVESDVNKMPFAADVILASPLDPEHPAVGREAVVQFIKTRVFPRIPVRNAKVERHIVEADCVATLWEAKFKSPEGGDVFIRIFDFFRVVDGLIKSLSEKS
jgi:SnoaL-like domain